VQRVLVSLGLTDVGAITARVTERLAPRLGGVCADIVVGASAPSLPGLRALAANDPRLTIHVDVTAMAGLMAQADIAVGAAGSSTWERCVLGLPSLMVVLADNQREAAQAMADRGAALVVEAGSADFETAFDGAVAQLLGQPALRAALSTWSAELCDGAGADRAAQAFLQVISSRDPAPQALRP
jgi:spore coat polysaccharide biosynthesis predicted glycosyltransferase SpsG